MRSQIHNTYIVKIPVRPSPGLREDLIWGVKAIAGVINRSERQTLYLLETGRLPAGKAGRQWYSAELRLRQHFALVPGRGVTHDPDKNDEARALFP